MFFLYSPSKQVICERVRQIREFDPINRWQNAMERTFYRKVNW